MTTILHIQSSSNLQGAMTRQIGPVAIDRLKSLNPGARIIERDLVKTPVPHVSPEFLGALFSGNDKAEGLALSNQLVDEVLTSDILVIEAPMYNFGIPSVLKAWVDHIARAHKTFRYAQNGPEGLLRGKKAVLITSSGGFYSEGPTKSFDHVDTYMRALLGFLGITDVETIRLEGVAMGKDKAAAALAQAKEKASSLKQVA